MKTQIYQRGVMLLYSLLNYNWHTDIVNHPWIVIELLEIHDHFGKLFAYFEGYDSINPVRHLLVPYGWAFVGCKKRNTYWVYKSQRYIQRGSHTHTHTAHSCTHTPSPTLATHTLYNGVYLHKIGVSNVYCTIHESCIKHHIKY